MELDEVLDKVGHFGKFQVINYTLIGITILLSSVYSLSYIFTAGDLEYRGTFKECEDLKTTSFNPEWLKNAVPFEDGPSRCLRYSFSNISFTNGNSCSAETFDKERQIGCHSWVYNGEESTIVNEWDITCDENQWKITLVGTVNNIGQFIGYPVAGYFSDRWGRKTALVACTVLAGLMGLARSLAWSYESFLVFEFLDPVVGSGIYTSGFTLSLELVNGKGRVLGGTLIPVFYAVGEVILGGVTWWLENWRYMLRIFYAPALLCISFHWLVPESVRWLITKGKKKEAKEIILKVAKTNKIDLSEEFLTKFEMTSLLEGKSSDSEKKSKTVKEVLCQVIHSKILLLRVLSCSFCWTTITFVFFGLSLTSVSVGENKYTSFILAALIELPAYVVVYLTMDRYGRKFTHSSSLILSGISCISFAFIPIDLDWLRMIAFLTGKFAITIAFTVVYVYTAELFPTELRQSLLGVCAMFGRIGFNNSSSNSTTREISRISATAAVWWNVYTRWYSVSTLT
ncbi:hypothetical protein L9F63_012122 [Diploptera punctata]|uniref:Major facilitator superfamily (MFS) profile domain-containing protein n=1 Tax=Diploptera punctata TaxID=6984 RepID=A0AAD8AE08_DIPPU|nr:hypothetical protein L9F63_012122 [Diploptera punctata]